MEKTKKEITDRLRREKEKCVRIDDINGFDTQLNKTHCPNELSRDMFYFSVKRVEQWMRGLSQPSVAMKKKFQKYLKVSEGLMLKALPEGFQSLPKVEKREAVKKVVDTFYNELAAAMSRAPVQADYPDDMQLGEGSGPDPASEGVAYTLRPPDDSLRNVPLGSVPSEGSPRVPPGSTPGLGSCTLNQLDYPGGRPPPSSRQCLEINQLMSDVECRASRFSGNLPEVDWLKQQVILCVNMLKDREMNERLSLEARSYLRRGNLEEIPSQLPEDLLAEDPQNQLSKASIEDAGFQGICYPASDFGVKNIETPMPHGEEDSVLRNRSISEDLEVVPRLTGRYRKNIGDIHPEVYGGSADGDLPSKPIMHASMEGFSTQASDLQVSDHCSGGENFVIKSTPGGNNTLQIVGSDPFVSTEPSADELNEWQYAMPVGEDLSHHWHSPVRHVSIDTLPA